MVRLPLTIDPEPFDKLRMVRRVVSRVEPRDKAESNGSILCFRGLFGTFGRCG